MREIKFQTETKFFIAISIASVAFAADFFVAQADVMSSASFKVQADTLSIGGGAATSASFELEDTLGEMATGEDLSSASFKACSGYQCFQQGAYLAFSVKEGLTEGGAVEGAGVDLGYLDSSSVKTSNNSDVNSIFINAESNGVGGSVVTVRSAKSGLGSESVPADEIASATASLVAGTEGYGICVYSVTQGPYSPSNLTKVSPYNDADCSTTVGHDAGLIDGTDRNILTASGQLSGGQAEILVKAAASSISPSHLDYKDTLTFIMTSTY